MTDYHSLLQQGDAPSVEYDREPAFDNFVSLEERTAAIRAIAGDTDLGKQADPSHTLALRKRRIVLTPEDIGIFASRSGLARLAAMSMEDLVKWSNGLYQIPRQFN